MADVSPQLTKLTDEYRRTKAEEAYDRIEEMAQSQLLKLEDPKTYYAANVWLVERGLGKTPDKLDVNIENAPWVQALRNSVRGSAPIEVEAHIVEPTQIELDEGDDEVIFWGAA